MHPALTDSTLKKADHQFFTKVATLVINLPEERECHYFLHQLFFHYLQLLLGNNDTWVGRGHLSI